MGLMAWQEMWSMNIYELNKCRKRLAKKLELATCLINKKINEEGITDEEEDIFNKIENGEF